MSFRVSSGGAFCWQVVGRVGGSIVTRPLAVADDLSGAAVKTIHSIQQSVKIFVNVVQARRQ
jgi:hypothetical protein